MIHTLVVGGTKGIGLTLVEELANYGHYISVVSRNSPKSDLFLSNNISHYQADISIHEQIVSFLNSIFNSKHELKNIVFMQRYRGEEWLSEFNTALISTSNIIDHAVSYGFKNGSIVIANTIASQYVVDEQPINYHVSKAGLLQLMRYYAVNLGSEKIRVNSVSPAMVLKDDTREKILSDEKLMQVYKQIIPLGFIPSSKQISDVIRFFCSDSSSAITGQNIIIDGGISLLGHETLSKRITNR